MRDREFVWKLAIFVEERPTHCQAGPCRPTKPKDKLIRHLGIYEHIFEILAELKKYFVM